MYSVEVLVKLLKCMWERSSPAIFFKMSGMTPPLFNEKEAYETLSNPRTMYVDYFCGRLIKTDFEKLDGSSFDRDMGQGAFKECCRKVGI